MRGCQRNPRCVCGFQRTSLSSRYFRGVMSVSFLKNLQKEDEVEKWNNYVDTYTYYCATRALMEANGFEFKQDFETEEEEKEYDRNTSIGTLKLILKLGFTINK